MQRQEGPEVSYQTLGDFMKNPFNQNSPSLANEKVSLDAKYRMCSRDIYFVASSEVSGSFLLHIKIPSQSRAGSYYDVVIQFFTQNENAVYGDSLAPYMLRFFSNSPSFVYRYSALYAEKNYLIPALQSKLNTESITRYPEKTNGTGKLSFDKSIYFACRYIQENQLSLLSKKALLRMRRVKLETLLQGVQHVDNIRYIKELDLEKGISKKPVGMKTKNRDAEAVPGDSGTHRRPLRKIHATKISASRNTSGVVRDRDAVRPKVAPKRSTHKNKRV